MAQEIGLDGSLNAVDHSVRPNRISGGRLRRQCGRRANRQIHSLVGGQTAEEVRAIYIIKFQNLIKFKYRNELP